MSGKLIDLCFGVVYLVSSIHKIIDDLMACDAVKDGGSSVKESDVKSEKVSK